MVRNNITWTSITFFIYDNLSSDLLIFKTIVSVFYNSIAYFSLLTGVSETFIMMLIISTHTMSSGALLSVVHINYKKKKNFKSSLFIMYIWTWLLVNKGVNWLRTVNVN